MRRDAYEIKKNNNDDIGSITDRDTGSSRSGII
jgi:hypothetical protein